MKPQISSLVWTNVATGEKTRRWHVKYDEGCRCECVAERNFESWISAARFAYHVAKGGSPWGFVA